MGVVSCWGKNECGQIGDGTRENRISPIAVVELSGVIAITAGAAHSCAISLGGKTSCWGNNDFGQLGDGSTTTRLLPTLVGGLSDAKAIVAGAIRN